MTLKTCKRFLHLTIISLFDFLSTIFLFLFSVLLYPTTHLRGIEKSLSYSRFLLPRGLALPSTRAYLDLQLGCYTRAVTSFEALIDKLENEKLKSKKNQVISKNILGDFYSCLAQAYLKGGRIDHASMVVIRAYNKLGVRNLYGMGDLDVKTSHIIRAGLSAGRLIDEGGVATLVVKSSSDKSASKRKGSGKNLANKKKTKELEPIKIENKVIAFPVLGARSNKKNPKELH